MSDSERNILQRSRFWNQNFYNAAVVYLNIKQRFRFCRKLCIHEITSCFVLYRNNGKFNSFCVFKRLQFEVFYFIVSDTDIKKLQRLRFGIEKYTTCQVSDELSYKVSLFELKCLQRARLWSKGCAACQISNWKSYKMSDFERNLWQSFRFWLW